MQLLDINRNDLEIAMLVPLTGKILRHASDNNLDVVEVRVLEVVVDAVEAGEVDLVVNREERRQVSEMKM